MNYETRISKNRTKLEEVIPLETPFIMFVEPSDMCNFQCKFCPTGDRDMIKTIKGRNHGSMSMDIYKKLIDDASTFPDKLKVLRFFKDGEPLMNKNLPEMVRYAKEKKVADFVDTTVNGSLFTHEMSDRLIQSGIDQINISIEGTSSEEYKEFSKYDGSFEKFYSNIKYLCDHSGDCHILVKINEDVISAESKQRFLDLFGPIADGVALEHTISCWPDYELTKVEPNKNVGIYGQAITSVDVCPYIFYSIAVNSNGTVSLCFLDWARNLIIGNIENESIVDIWNGDLINEYRIDFLLGNRKDHSFCGKCGQLSQGMPDNIDEYKDTILKNIKGYK